MPSMDKNELPSQIVCAFRLKAGVFSYALAIVTFLGCLSCLEAPALSTGIPVQFNVDPATVRQREKNETPVIATVILKVPSPTFFACQIRSSDKDKISFSDIIFKKGQIKGTATGIVHWGQILRNCDVKISAFSVDAPEEKLWFTLALKIKDPTQPESEPKP